MPPIDTAEPFDPSDVQLDWMDGFIGEWIADVWTKIIDDRDEDVIFAPQERARMERKLSPDSDDYNMPFISYYRPEPISLDTTKYNHKLASQGVKVCIPGDDEVVTLKTLPVEFQYEIDYFDGANRTRRNYFETTWVEHQRGGTPLTIPTPFFKPGQDDPENAIEMDYTYELGDPQNMSQVENIMETGIEMRVNGTMTFTAYLFKPSDPDGSIIEDIFLDFIIEELGGQFLERTLHIDENRNVVG